MSRESGDGAAGDGSRGRGAGVLLHPTSLPGPHGIGELGPEALRFVDFLREGGQSIWQMLPLGPTDPGGSPYSSPSAFAGNPLLVSTDRLVEDGLMEHGPRQREAGPVDYSEVTENKALALREAFAPVQHRIAGGASDPDFDAFREQNRAWLEDYALYAALKERFRGAPWTAWDGGLARREPTALAEARRERADEIVFHEWVQYRFFRDWVRVKGAANRAGIEVIGDIPIFVAHDSADVWADQSLFSLDGSGEPSVVAGVPPDYFSEAGQLWGNPLYRWDRMERDDYSWWIARVRQALTLYDAIRLDHFRGFEAYWEVPASEKTARNGRWVEGPGRKLFDALRRSLGDLPFVAEDLGEVSPAVEALRDGLGLPGMKILQFAFSGPDNGHLPHNFPGANAVVYTGTHDNDTTAGWWSAAPQGEKRFARRYLGKKSPAVSDFVRLAHSSVAARSIIPMQDLLSLGSEARLNIPGTAEGNWTWRMDKDALTPELTQGLHELTELYNRHPDAG